MTTIRIIFSCCSQHLDQVSVSDCQDGFIFINISQVFLFQAFDRHLSPAVLIHQSVEFALNVSILYFLFRSLDQRIWLVDRHIGHCPWLNHKYCNLYQVNVGFPEYNLPSERQVCSYHNILSHPRHKHNGRTTLKKNWEISEERKDRQAFQAFPFQFTSCSLDKRELPECSFKIRISGVLSKYYKRKTI